MPQRRTFTAAAAIVLAGFLAVLIVRPGGAGVTQAFDDITTTAFDVVAALACALRARSLSGRARTSWALLAVACLAWAIGDGLWAYDEVVAGREAPFPSVADVFYLAFPVIALAGLLSRPSAVLRGQGRARVTLDAVLLAASLFTLSWTTALGAAYRGGGDSLFAAVVSVAYPATDIVLVAVALLAVTHAGGRGRTSLFLLAGGLGCMALADSGFTYLTAVGDYTTGGLMDAGWLAAALLVSLAAVSDGPSETQREPALPTSALLFLPYLPAAIGVAVAMASVRDRHENDIALVGEVVIVGAVLVRQLLVLLDNRALLAVVRRQAFTDPLTGLANRALFKDRLVHSLDLHRRDLRPVSLLLMDLDEFKTVNDTLGHPAGDDLLMRVAERLRAATRPGDTVARLGGDEFAVLIEDGGDPVAAGLRILTALEQPVLVEGRQLMVRGSVGVAQLPVDHVGVDAVEMFKRVDLAMYAAKRRGKSQLVAYSDDLVAHDATELELLGAFAADLSAGRIGIAYQPIYAADGELIAFEALARWSHDGIPVSPADFLPMAQTAGLLPALDELVLRTAVAECASWPQPGPSITVNSGADQLARPDLAEMVSALLADHDLAPDRLVVEVPEGQGLCPAAVANLHRLHDLGVRIALDDFGVGFSSVERLQVLPLDLVKVDRAFVSPLSDGAAGTELLSGIIALAHGIGAQVIAEGVEEPHQLERLAALGCDSMQGFLLGRPQPDAATVVATARVRSATPA